MSSEDSDQPVLFFRLIGVLAPLSKTHRQSMRAAEIPMGKRGSTAGLYLRCLSS